MKLNIIYEDEHLLVLYKPAGVPVQSARVGAKDCESLVKNYLYEKNPGKGAPYLGIIHRLDQPVEGLVVFALTPAAAAALSRQSAERKMEKTYLAVRRIVDNSGVENRNCQNLCGKPLGNVEKRWKTGRSVWTGCAKMAVRTVRRSFLPPIRGRKRQFCAIGSWRGRKDWSWWKSAWRQAATIRSACRWRGAGRPWRGIESMARLRPGAMWKMWTTPSRPSVHTG